MNGPRIEAILKENVKRTVFLEPERRPAGTSDRDRPQRVVKRFHGPGPWQRQRDGARAARELEAHRRLHRLGLPVPEPIEVRRVEGAWELVTEWIEGSVSLRAVLLEEGPWPDAPERIAARLGALLALLHRTGVDHADLHAGNVLLDRGGRPWLVDLAGARVRARLPAATLVRDLVRTAAGARERLSEGFRARFLVAYLRGLPSELRSKLGERRGLDARVERVARVERRRIAQRQARRWIRASGACQPIRLGRLEGFARAGLDPRILGEIDLAFDREAGSGFPGDPATAVIRVAGLPESALERRWLAAARLEAHRVPGARPLALILRPRRAALFTVPSDARPLAARLERMDARERARAALSLGHLIGSLHDRGLSVPGLSLADLVSDAEGRVQLGILRGLRDLDPSRPDRRRAEWVGLAAELAPSRRERALFAGAYAAAHRSGGPERARLREELRRG